MASDNSPHRMEQTTLETTATETNHLPDSAQAPESVTASSNDKAPQWRKMKKLKSVISRFKIGIIGTVLTVMLAVLTLTLTLGQYYQTGYTIRIGITEIWKDGYTADTRDRVAKFVFHYHQYWKHDHKRAETSLDILVDPGKVFDGKTVRNDENLAKLLAFDVEERAQQQNRAATDNDYTEAALKYRNALIECLNTVEAVKAVIHAKPRWMKIFGKPDLLEERYKYLIIQRTEELFDFMQRYRHHNQRRIAAWYILTEVKLDESD
jgi:hypothetical protein